jgi:NADH:ubiquinone oxidoreductase subunit K
MALSTPTVVLAAGLVIAGLGLVGLLTTRHLLRALVAMQIMAKGALLVLLAAGQASGRVELAQALIVSVIVADTVVVTAGLALAIRVWRRLGTLDLAALGTLRG